MNKHIAARLTSKNELVAALFLAITVVVVRPSVPGRQSVSAAVDSSLVSQVTIRRDTYGIPHILAATEEAAAFGMGYAQAEDHCVEIARRFVGARGEAAKHLGEFVEDDFRMKRYGNYEVAKQGFDKLAPLFQRMMSAFAAGLNLYVEQHRKELPSWIPIFDGVDVLARGRAEVMRFAFDESAIRAVQAKYPTDSRVGQAAPTFKLSDSNGSESDLMGSNMWALAPSRTTSGKAILLGNPHQAWAALYYEAHVTVPGKINFFGGTFVGRPVLTSGFNEHLGWTHTVNNVDLDDIYAIQVDPNKPDHYLFDGKSMPLRKKEISVDVKTADGSIRTERRTYWESHIGPVVHRTTDKVFSVKSAILDAFRYYEEWYALGKTRNLLEFTAALRVNQIPMFNLCYADVEGNILYLWNGTIPKRLDDGTDYRLDIPGASKYVWTKLHKTEDLPQLLNPSGGYVQNCNDPPWYTSLRNLLDPKKYPSYFEPGRQVGLRTQMSLEMLEGREKFSLEDVRRLKFNNKMLLADRVKPDLITAIKRIQSPSDDLKRGLAVLEAWDNTVSANSRGGVLFQRFWDNYRAANRTPFAVSWDRNNPAKTPRGLSDPALAVKHFEDAVRWIRETHGSEDVSWGEVHRIRLGALDLPGDGASGEYGLFRVAHFGPTPGGKRIIGVANKGRPMVGGGDGFIMAIEFSKPIRAYSLLAYGQTSNPVSKHSSDQARLFANHEMKPVWFSEAEIKANLERSYRPVNSEQ